MATQIQLSPRLQAVADWIPENCLFADIGTDHGNLPCWLLQQGRATQAIASDLREGPLSSARTHAAQHNISMDFRLCDGLQGISPSEVTAIAIAGMGGITISQILEKWCATWHSPWEGIFVLQPMSTQPQLRLWLNSHQFSILEERTIREGTTLYTIMKVMTGQQSPYTLGEQLVGKQWEGMMDPLRSALLDRVLEKTQLALSSASTGQPSPRQEALQQQITALTQLKKEWITWNP